MLTKISVAINGLLIVAAVALAVNLNSFTTTVDTLMNRVTNLEVQNVQLSKQMEWLENNRSPGAQQTGFRTSVKRGASLSNRNPSVQKADVSATSDSDEPAATGDLADLKANLRQEVEAMVAEEQSTARERHRQEWETRLREGMNQSLNDFAEDQNIDDEAKQTLSTLMDEAMNRRQALRDELESRNISFYEFRQEERKMTEEMQAKYAEVLNPEQLAAFQESFPMGMRGRGGGRGGRR